MAPKKNKKGRKLTKSERLKKQQEEEERRLQEEEEARLRAEREEREKLETERKQREFEELQLKEFQRQDDELNELRYLLERNQIAVTRWKKEATEAADWERYLRCDGAPDPKEQKEVNTFITLWRDDPEVKVTELLKPCHVALQLIEELEDLFSETTDPKKHQIYQEGLVNLQELIHLKLNLTNEDILKSANKNVDHETGYMQTVIKDKKITLCLWANLIQVSSFKGYTFKDVGLGFELPKQLAVSSIAVRILYTSYDDLSMLSRIFYYTPKAQISPQLTGTGHDVQEVDLMEYTPLGGVFHYEVFHLPPQAYKVGKWVMQEILNTGLQKFPYPSKSSLGDSEAQTCSPVGVSVSLPDHVIFFKSPQVARWEAADKKWRLDRITDVSYEEAESKISFKMETFQPFVLMQETYINFPFRSWELRPLGQDAARFTVNGGVFNLSVTIKDDQCMLEQERGPAHLVGKWMSRPALQKAMINSGINIFVNEHTQNYVSICTKDSRTERAAYEQMALSASACGFSRSKWNTECGAEQLILQVCEHHDPGPVPEDSWSLYLLDAQRSYILQMTEISETFSLDHYSGREIHSTLFHMLQDNMSPDGTAKIRESHHVFVDTVQAFLCATRPLVYS